MFLSSHQHVFFFALDIIFYIIRNLFPFQQHYFLKEKEKKKETQSLRLQLSAVTLHFKIGLKVFDFITIRPFKYNIVVQLWSMIQKNINKLGIIHKQADLNYEMFVFFKII